MTIEEIQQKLSTIVENFEINNNEHFLINQRLLNKSLDRKISEDNGISLEGIIGDIYLNISKLEKEIDYQKYNNQRTYELVYQPDQLICTSLQTNITFNKHGL